MFTQVQEPNETLETSHAVLTPQAARSRVSLLQDPDKTGSVRYVTFYDSLTIGTLSAEEEMKGAEKLKLSKKIIPVNQKNNQIELSTSGTNQRKK